MAAVRTELKQMITYINVYFGMPIREDQDFQHTKNRTEKHLIAFIKKNNSCIRARSVNGVIVQVADDERDIGAMSSSSCGKDKSLPDVA